ncbi:MAG TPA: UvrD-helicase domain-containing protein, partial [Stellaceae bacterium]|nr:UvrD-helicase domain-containing protein [Stellaceae bacterium]
MSRAGAPTAAQQAALHPAVSVWVAASAGTGKTRVLTDRLLALMLDGTDPARILCLTFTRAAAAEMANRVNNRLAAWATLAPGALAEELVALTGQMPQEHEIARARQLFARVLDAPGGAKIATIHAFCQSLLRRFPLEAGVPPEFSVIEERSAAEAVADAVETVIAAARAGQEPGLAEALAVVARHTAEERFGELMTALVRERSKLQRALSDGETALHRRLCAALSVREDATVDSVTEAFCTAGACDEAALRAAAAALVGGSATDRERGRVVGSWCEQPETRRQQLDDYLTAFLTEAGDIRQRLITNGAAAKEGCGDAPAALDAEANRIRGFMEMRAAVALAA